MEPARWRSPQGRAAGRGHGGQRLGGPRILFRPQGGRAAPHDGARLRLRRARRLRGRPAPAPLDAHRPGRHGPDPRGASGRLRKHHGRGILRKGRSAGLARAGVFGVGSQGAAGVPRGLKEHPAQAPLRRASRRRALPGGGRARVRSARRPGEWGARSVPRLLGGRRRRRGADGPNLGPATTSTGDPREEGADEAGARRGGRGPRPPRSPQHRGRRVVRGLVRAVPQIQRRALARLPELLPAAGRPEEGPGRLRAPKIVFGGLHGDDVRHAQTVLGHTQRQRTEVRETASGTFLAPPHRQTVSRTVEEPYFSLRELEDLPLGYCVYRGVAGKWQLPPVVVRVEEPPPPHKIRRRAPSAPSREDERGGPAR